MEQSWAQGITWPGSPSSLLCQAGYVRLMQVMQKMEMSMKWRKKKANRNLKYMLQTVLWVTKAFYVQHIPNDWKIGGIYKWLKLKVQCRNGFHLCSFGTKGSESRMMLKMLTLAQKQWIYSLLAVSGPWDVQKAFGVNKDWNPGAGRMAGVLLNTGSPVGLKGRWCTVTVVWRNEHLVKYEIYLQKGQTRNFPDWKLAGRECRTQRWISLLCFFLWLLVVFFYFTCTKQLQNSLQLNKTTQPFAQEHFWFGACSQSLSCAAFWLFTHNWEHEDIWDNFFRTWLRILGEDIPTAGLQLWSSSSSLALPNLNAISTHLHSL